MTVNVPLLRKALEFAEESAARQQEVFRASDPPREGVFWKQSRWSSLTKNWIRTKNPEQLASLTPESCGTSYCIAGYVTQLDPTYHAEIKTSELDPGTNDYMIRLVEYVNGEAISDGDQSEIARRALGLTHTEAEKLFYPYNTIERVRQLAERFAGEPLRPTTTPERTTRCRS